ncbi:MAG: hypothetical protein PF505_03950 [Vallitaleaceae bacterium]|jgi:hypothetical protein|nr:hypothetical protein [Vallitaleaceae bacterium]
MKRESMGTWLKTYKRTIITIAIIVGCIMIVSISGILIYLSAHMYDISETPIIIEQYLSAETPAGVYKVQDNTVEITIPKEILTTEIIRRTISYETPKHYDLKALRVNDQGRLEVNATYYGFKWSFSCAISISVVNNDISLDISDMTLTDKGITFLYNMQQKKLEYFLGGLFPMAYDLNAFERGELITLESFNYINKELPDSRQLNGDYVALFIVDEEKLINEFKLIRDTANEDILQMYQNSETLSDKMAAEYINNVDNLKIQDIENFIKDYIGEKNLLHGILLMSNIERIEALFQKYPAFLSELSQSEIIDTKGTVLSGNLREYYTQFMTELETAYFSEEEMYYSLGQPYSFDKGPITVSLINEEQGLGISESIIEKMKFCYEVGTGVIKLSYVVDDNTFLVLGDDSQALYRKDAYDSTYGVPDYGEAHYVDDPQTWDAIEGLVKEFFGVDQVFIRFLKTDEHYAFAIVSPESSYQNYWVFAFEKIGDHYEIIMDNVSTIRELNEEHPEFNLELTTKEIEDVVVYNVNDETKLTILEDMSNKGIIGNQNNYEVLYCSYGDDYLDLLLDNDIEYVYYIYGTHLHTVYTKEEAIRMWPNLSEIITLQDRPIVVE